MLNFFKGKRTYICAILIAALAAAKFLGWVSEELYQEILALLGAGGLAALRIAMPDADQGK